MKSACSCLAVLPALGQFADYDSNLVLLQRHAEAKITASGGAGESLEDEWHFCGAEVSSNLGGLGPDVGAPRELRYKRVLKLPRTGQELDLVVTNTTEYSVNDIRKNGEAACFGRINVKSPGSLTMRFKLVATGSDDFVDDSEHDFTVMDLDHGKNGMMESITTSGFIGTPTSVITPVLAADGVSYTFKGLESSIAIKDPKSPWDLTQPQKDAGVGFKFSGRDSWEVTYNTWDDNGLASRGGRNFLFTGKTSLQDEAPTEAPTPAPTETPTPAPTETPTPAPTEAPTPAPTQAPTPAPTETPTPAPTEAPTPSPTLAPTPAPTATPTPAPTGRETVPDGKACRQLEEFGIIPSCTICNAYRTGDPNPLLEHENGYCVYVPSEKRCLADRWARANVSVTLTDCQDTPWLPYGEDNSKCVSLSDEFSEPISQSECQTQAAKAGHDYYQYTTEAGGQCATTPTCDTPTTGTSYDWKIFKKDTPWPQYGEDNSKCASLGDEFSEPISQSECQTRAANAGHDYYQYTTEAGGQCATAPTCDTPTTGTSYDWKIFKKADCILPDSINDGTKCGDPGNPNRLMDLREGDATLQMCSTECANDPECVAFSGIWGQWCIGCKVPLSAGHTGAVAYKDACKAATTSATTPDDVEGIVKPYGSCNADSRSPTTAGMTCLKSADKIDLKCSSGKCVGGAGKNAKCRSNKFTGKTHKGEFICKNGLRCAGYIDGKQWGKCVN